MKKLRRIFLRLRLGLGCDIVNAADCFRLTVQEGGSAMFGRKKKKALFGANVETDCRCCRRNGAKQEDEPLCTLRLKPKDGKCKKFEYDPLRRQPRSAPPLRAGQFSEEDFKL